MEQTRNIIHLYKDGNSWCAIYPMGSNLMECNCVEFSPIELKWSNTLSRMVDYGKQKALELLKKNNPDLPTHSFYCEQ